MITLITGQPGDGKSLYTITMVKAVSEKEGRSVYYSGIPDLRLPWIELTEPEKWYECPAGSIIVIDEAQRIFRPRGNGAAVPRHVAELETHRHKGHDIYIVTQQPMLVDSNVRRLVGRHFHAKRKFGAPASTVHEWSQVRERPDQNRAESIRHEFLFPKSTYALYKSAEIHTHKLRVPMRLWAMLALPLVFAAVVYYAVQWFKGRVSPAGGAVASQVVQGEIRAVPVASGRSGRRDGLSAAEYFESYQPRIPGMLMTAPRYDAKTVAVHVPYPAACIATARRCQCYTQQATILEVGDDYCRSIVAKGYFLDFEPVRTQESMARADRLSESRSSDRPSAEQAGGYVPVTAASEPRHAAPSQERSGETGEGLSPTVRSAIPFVGPFEGVSGR